MKNQRGITMIGMLFVATVVVFAGLLTMKVVPTMLEYQTILKAVKKAGAEATSIPQAQDITSWSKATEWKDQNISSITPKDLIIEQISGGYRVSFAYNKEIPLFGPAFLVIKYEGSSGNSKSPTGGI